MTSCPVHRVSCATAYNRRGCRCAACRTWNSDHSRRQRERRGGRNRTFHWSQERINESRYAELTEEFIRAVRIDPHYIEDFARAYWAMQDGQSTSSKEAL